MTRLANWAAALVPALLASTAVVVLQRRREAGATRARRVVNGDIAHEMRTPLAKVRMYTEMLLLGQERSAEERAQWLDTIDHEAHRLGEVMENLLLYLHTDEGGGFPARRPTDLAGLVDDIAATFAGRAARRDVRLVVEAPPGAIVNVDPGPLRQAVANLLDDAIRHARADHTVAVTLSSGGGEVVVAISDQGCSDLDTGPVPHGPNGADGSGFGLLVAARVAAAHGGRLRIGTAALLGARVALVLPAARAASVDYTVPRRNARRRSAGSRSIA